LAIFEHSGWFNFIGGKVIEFDDCYLSGYDYDKTQEEETHFDMPVHDYKKNKFKVLVMHSMVSGDKKSMVINGKRCITSYRDIVTNADMFLCGHYHPGIGLKKTSVLEHDVYFGNPGSLARTSTVENEIGLGPALLHVKIHDGKVKIFKAVKIPCDRSVFKAVDAKTKYDVKDYASERFFDALGAFKNVAVVKNDIGLLLKGWIGKEKEMGMPFAITQELIDYTVRKVREVETCQTK
jgi:hypothetical protein